MITEDQFNPENAKRFALKDDVWLWNLLRNIEPNDKTVQMIKEAALYRESKNIITLWKNRRHYRDIQKKVAKRCQHSTPLIFERTISYQERICAATNTTALISELDFEPVSEKSTRLFSEKGQRLIDDDLFEVSKLVSNLKAIWKDEPQYYVLFVGEGVSSQHEELLEQWIDLTANWIS